MKNLNIISKTFIIISILNLILYNTLIFATYIPNDTTYVWSESVIETANSEENSDFLDLTCESAILIEQTTGNILYEKDSHIKLRPASVTKIMTILLIMESIEKGKISLDTPITCSENAANMGGSQIWLEVRRNINCR